MIFLIAAAAAAAVTPEAIAGGGVAALLAGVKYLTSGIGKKLDDLDDKVDEGFTELKIDVAVIKNDVANLKD